MFNYNSSFRRGNRSGRAVDRFVTIEPQKYFVGKIAGDLIDVQVMVPAGADPHNYEPKPRQMAVLSRAAAYFTIGIAFEDAWLQRIASTNPKMKIFHTDEGIAKIPVTAHHHEGDHEEEADHGHEDGHRHQGLDPHVWTSPVQVRILAQNILQGLVEIDPAHAEDYKRGHDEFAAELDELDRKLHSVLDGSKGTKFMVFHPAWGYLAHDYGLVQVAVEQEGKEPKPAQLKELIEEAREEGIKVVFVQPQISPRSAETIARAIDGEVVPVNPLAPDWKSNLELVAEKFAKVLKQE